MYQSTKEPSVPSLSDAATSGRATTERTQMPKLALASIKALPESNPMMQFPTYEQIPHTINPIDFLGIRNSRSIQHDIIQRHLETPHIKVPNEESPFSKCEVFPKGSQIIAGKIDTSDVGTCFPNLETAEEYIRYSARRSMKDDVSVPTDPAVQRVLVAILKYAFQSTALAMDRTDYVTTFASACHDPRIVEYHCWKLLHAIIDRARSGEPVAGSYGSIIERSRNQYDDFCDLFDSTRYALQAKKTLCNQILDCPNVVKLADDPLARINKSIENQFVNDQKRKDIDIGRRARVEAGQIAPSRKRARKGSYTAGEEQVLSQNITPNIGLQAQQLDDHIGYDSYFSTGATLGSFNDSPTSGHLPTQARGRKLGTSSGHYIDDTQNRLLFSNIDGQAALDQAVVNTGAGLQTGSDFPQQADLPFTMYPNLQAIDIGTTTAADLLGENNFGLPGDTEIYDGLFSHIDNAGTISDQSISDVTWSTLHALGVCQNLTEPELPTQRSGGGRAGIGSAGSGGSNLLNQNLTYDYPGHHSSDPTDQTVQQQDHDDNNREF